MRQRPWPLGGKIDYFRNTLFAPAIASARGPRRAGPEKDPRSTICRKRLSGKADNARKIFATACFLDLRRDVSSPTLSRNMRVVAMFGMNSLRSNFCAKSVRISCLSESIPSKEDTMSIASRFLCIFRRLTTLEGVSLCREWLSMGKRFNRRFAASSLFCTSEYPNCPIMASNFWSS